MKVLVTGGAGFIGSHLAEALCQRGDQVIVLDDFSTGQEANLAWRRPEHDLELVRGDVGDEALVRRWVTGCDWVFHEAAVASVPRSVEEPLATNRINLDATLTLICAARDARVQRFVFASSSAIYGDSDAPLKAESQAPRPLSPYALQKYAGERYCQLATQLYGLTTVSLRYFNVFGPRQAFDSPYSGVIAKFCTAALAGQPPVVFGDGQQSRDFVSVENVVAANLLAAEQPATVVGGRVFNIAGGRSLSLLELLAALNQLTGQHLQPQFAPARAGDVPHSRADLTAASRELGFSTQVGLEEGLRRTLEFYRAGDRIPARAEPEEA